MVRKIIGKMYTINVINWAVSRKKNLGTTCHRTSLTFSETTYTSEAQYYAKVLYHQAPWAPLRFTKQKKKMEHNIDVLN